MYFKVFQKHFQLKIINILKVPLFSQTTVQIDSDLEQLIEFFSLVVLMDIFLFVPCVFLEPRHTRHFDKGTVFR